MTHLKEDGSLDNDHQISYQTKKQVLQQCKKLDLQELLKKGAMRLEDVIAEIEKDIK